MKLIFIKMKKISILCIKIILAKVNIYLIFFSSKNYYSNLLLKEYINIFNKNLELVKKSDLV